MKEALLDILNRFSGTRVAVIADIIADEFVYGEISRISREAPVLILRHREDRILPGGGGNAIYNLSSLGAEPVPFGSIGRDEGGEAILREFRDAGIPTNCIAVDKSRRTTRKTRILASLPHSNRQQVLRIDREEPVELPAGGLDHFLGRILPTCSGLLISDYGLGCAPPSLAAHPALRSFRRTRPVTVDSRHRILGFPGLTAATPNEGEVESAIGVKIGDDPAALDRAGRSMLRRLQSQAILITRGNRGMSLFESGERPVHIPIYGGEEIADVTGAGDTVIAVFTLALACGASFHEAAVLANYAGGLVVMKRGTATVNREELTAAIEADEPLEDVRP